MLKNISPLLTGDLLKVLCDMGHDDELVLADANFPAESIGRRVIHCPGINVSDFLEAALPLFPLDPYSEWPAAVMELTAGDRQKGMPRPVVWNDYYRLLAPHCPWLTCAATGVAGSSGASATVGTSGVSVATGASAAPAAPDLAAQDKVFEYVERFAFYERAKKAYAVIQTGEVRQYGNLLLVKGVV